MYNVYISFFIYTISHIKRYNLYSFYILFLKLFILNYNRFYFNLFKIYAMKKICYLLFLFTLLISCNQTLLTSNFSKSKKKIYVKAPNKKNHNSLSINERKTTDYLIVESTKKEVKKTIHSTIKSNNKELYACTNTSDLKENFGLINTNQNLKSLNSFIKDYDSTKVSEKNIKNLSEKAKNFSIAGASGSIIAALLFHIDENVGWGKNISRNTKSFLSDFIPPFSLILGICGFILMGLGINFLIKTLKKIKKNKETIKDQDKSIRNNIKLAFLIPLLFMFIPIIIGIIILLTFSIGIGSIGPFYF